MIDNKKLEDVGMKMKSFVMTSVLVASSIGASYASIEIENIAEDNSVSLTLNMDDKRFTVTGGCNTIIGGVEINEFDTFIAAKNLASTLMACSEPLEKMSTRINSFLENQPKIVQQEGKLYLVGSIFEEDNSVYIPVVLDQGEYKTLKAENYDRVFIYVSNEKVPCSTNPKSECLQIRSDKNDAWKPFEGMIEGFSPEEGITYRLRLKEYHSGQDDQRWVYDMAVEQEIVQ